jgi:hypothetical protein
VGAAAALDSPRIGQPRPQHSPTAAPLLGPARLGFSFTAWPWAGRARVRAAHRAELARLQLLGAALERDLASLTLCDAAVWRSGGYSPFLPWASLAGGLLEAAALLAADPATPVLLAYFDDDLPAPYDAFQLEPAAGPLALAVLLGSPSVDCAAIQFVATPRLSAPSSATALPARAFLRFLAENLPSAEAGGARFQVAWCRAT